jgi:hypothetical protein
MTPKEKATELVKKFTYNTRCFSETKGWEDTLYDAKQCALIAVEEIRFFHESLFYATQGNLFDDYLNKVKDEINQL